jgi:chemotaxis protein CheD
VISEALDHVAMSEVRVSASAATAFLVPGLGSCIALVIYQPGRKLAGMAHVLLPDSSQSAAVEVPGKFADTAVPALLAKLVALGADRSALVAKIAGGAQMFKLGPGPSVGARNIEAVTRALEAHQIPLVASDIGGEQGRTVRFEVASECFWIRSKSGAESRLE